MESSQRKCELIEQIQSSFLESSSYNQYQVYVARRAVYGDIIVPSTVVCPTTVNTAGPAEKIQQIHSPKYGWVSG